MSCALASDPFRVGLGTYRLGNETEAVCLQALKLGYRHIDTAAIYRNEAAVAQAIRNSGIPREEIFLTSKLSISDLQTDRILEATRTCLDQLGSVDLLLLHAPTEHFVEDWKTLQQVLTWDAVKAVGVSNFDTSHLQQLDSPLPLINQIEVSPFLPRQELVAHCRKHSIHIVAHSSLTKAKRLSHPILQEIAQELQATPAQVLLAWGIHQGFTVLPRSTNPLHLKENWEAQHIAFSTAQLTHLEALEDGFATHPQHLQG